MALLCFVFFLDQCTMSFLEEKRRKKITCSGLLKSSLVPKTKKINKKYCTIIRLSKEACVEIQAF